MNALPQVETPQAGARRILAKFLSAGFVADGLHCYADASGTPAFYRARCKHPVTGEKHIRPMRLDGLRFVVGEPPAPATGKLLYRLPELIAADPAVPVLVVEGEKCADALARLGLIATTSGSASSAASADWTPLRGRSVIVWPDHDESGAQYADAVGAALRAIGCVVERIDVANLGLPDKGDCVDWLAAHPDATAADMLALPRGKLGDAEPDRHDDDLPPLPAPTITEAMYYGLTGEVMRAATEGKETNPAAVGAAFLSMAAVAFGREVTVTVGDARHAPRLFTCHVGRSSAAGKGMALELVKRIRRRADEIHGPLQKATGHLHDGGLSSREGLAWMIRDESDTKDKDGEPTDPGVEDKRLWVVEEEFANVLHQAQRDGNTLSSALRTAWDGGDLAPATKNNRTRASRPHIGMHASITPFELSELLDANAVSNGFANRFLFVWGERRGIVPFPPRTPDNVVNDLAQRLLDCIAATKIKATMAATDAARSLYATFYRQHRRGAGLSSDVRGLIQRHPPYAWRLAATFARLDRSGAIEAPHMGAALAWLDYFRASTVLIFSTATHEADAANTSALAERILKALGEAGGAMDREPLRQVLGKPSKSDFDKALSHLAETGQATESASPRVNGGRARRTITMASAEPPQRFARFARFGSTQGPEQTADALRFGTVCPDDGESADQTAETAKPLRFAGTRANSQTAQTAETAEGPMPTSGEVEEVDL